MLRRTRARSGRQLLAEAALVALVAGTAACGNGYPEDPVDGQVHFVNDYEFKAWDASGGGWLDPEAFWRAYAQRRGGITWGEGTAYPPYSEVEELDTFMVILSRGPCLMEFFHERWRRANDVRRWDPAFNDYGGCTDVFKDD